MAYSSRLLEEAVDRMAHLPGIGRKTALRLCLHLIRNEKQMALSLADAVIRLVNEVHFCRICHNLSDEELCSICTDPKRQADIICVVEDIRDVLAIEKTTQYHGVYHVLGGVISPIEGIGPKDLTITSLVERVNNQQVKEVVLALPATVEGDTTNLYIYKLIGEKGLLVTTIARGVAVGDHLEYADEATLGRSILHRTPIESFLNR